MGLIADAVGVGTGCRDKEVERLHTGITGAFCHNIKELSVRLGVQLIKNDAVDIEAVLGVGLSGQHLIEAVGRLVDDTLLGSEYLHAPVQRRTHTHHIGGNIKNDGRLLAVSCAAIDFGTFLTITAGQEQGHGSSEFGFSHLLRDFHIRGIELAIAIRF